MQETAQNPAGSAAANEQLVALRTDVLNDVEHAVGNLLQRMHHVARSARAELGAQGERLHVTLDELEQLLGLFFDYVSPVELQLRATDGARVAESLAAQLRGHGAAVTVEPVAVPAVVADARTLSRSFALLAQAGARDWDGTAVAIAATRDASGEHVAFEVRGAQRAVVVAAAGVLATAVARRLIELQGGELRERPTATCLCSVVLPVAG
ncbi:MAG: hypothetical protein ABI629_16635 [bacterium]